MTFGLLTCVMVSVWAFDLERHGKAQETPGRQESLGTYVLVLNMVGLILVLLPNWTASIIGVALTVAAVWLLEKEINLYSTS